MTDITEAEAAEIGHDALRAIVEDDAAAPGVIVRTYVATSEEQVLVLEVEGRGWIIWDADTDVEVRDTEREAMITLTRGLVNTYEEALDP